MQGELKVKVCGVNTSSEGVTEHEECKMNEGGRMLLLFTITIRLCMTDGSYAHYVLPLICEEHGRVSANTNA